MSRVPPTAVFSGLTAAWLHGLDVPCEPIEVTIPKGIGGSARKGFVVRRAAVAAGDIVNVRGKRATSLLRTLSDVSSRLSMTEAVVVVDMALHAGLTSLADLKALCVARAHRVGVANLRRIAGFAEPAAESPMESRLRMVLVLGGLPRPQAQISLHDKHGRFVGRPDLPESSAWHRIRRGYPPPKPRGRQPPPEPHHCRGISAAALHGRRCPSESRLGQDPGARDACKSTDFPAGASPRGLALPFKPAGSSAGGIQATPLAPAGRLGGSRRAAPP